MALPSSESPLDAAVRRAQVAFATNVAGDSAVDSIVYDLQAYEPTVVPSLRFAALTREGVYGFYADADVASMAVVNRRAFAPARNPDEPTPAWDK